VRDALVPFGINEPDALILRVGEVDFAAGVNSEIIRFHAVGDDRFLAIGGPRHDALATILACIEAAVGSEHQAVGGTGVFAEDCHFAID
jgi:hypothetical protein